MRRGWSPETVAVEVRRATFFERPPFSWHEPVLANAFHVADVDYRWERGRVVPAAEG